MTCRRPDRAAAGDTIAGALVDGTWTSSGASHAVTRPDSMGASFSSEEKGARSGFVAPKTTAAGMLRVLAAVVMVGLPYFMESMPTHGAATSRNPKIPASVTATYRFSSRGSKRAQAWRAMVRRK